MTRNRFATFVISVLLLLTATACGARSEAEPGGLPDTLRVGLIPNIAPETQRARYEPFGRYLSEQLGVKVELFVATDYAGVVTALVSKKVDVAYLGGLTYVQAAQQARVTPLVTEIDHATGTREYHSGIVVKADSKFTSTKDIVAAGSRFAFGDASSTSGSLYPRVMLTDAGARCSPGDLLTCPPLASVAFTGGHDATAQAVHNGSVDAGGLELRILRRLESEGAIPKGALRVVETREVMGYPWVAREGLDQPAREAIVGAFLTMSDQKLLDLMRARRYARVSVSDYAEVRESAAELGLLTASR